MPLYCQFKSKSLRKKIETIFCLGVLLFPLLSFLPLSEPFILGRKIFLHTFSLLSAFILLTLLIKRGCFFLFLSPHSKTFLLFLIYLMGLSLYQNQLFHLLTLFSMMICFAFFASGFLNSERFKDALLRLAPFFCLFYLLLYFLIPSGWGKLFSSQEGGAFGHPQFFSAWILLLFPMLFMPQTNKTQLSFLTSSRFKWNQAFHLLMIVFVSSFLLLKGESRFLSFLCLLNILIFNFPYKKTSKTSSLFFFFTLFLLCGFMWVFRDPILISFRHRIFIWELCLDALSQKSFFGKGVAQFEFFYQTSLNAALLKNPLLFQSGVSNGVEWAHNEWIHSYVEYGFPSLVFLSALSFLLLKELFCFYRKADPHFFFYFGLANLLLYSLVSFPFRMPCSGLLALFLWALLSCEKGKNSITGFHFYSPPKKRKILPLIVIEMVFLLIFCLSILNFKEFMGLFYFSKAMKHPQKTSSHLLFLNKSISFFPHSKLTLFALAKTHLEKKEFFQAEYYFKKASKLVPSFPILYGLALSKDLNGKHEQALDLYEKLKIINPDFRPVTHNLEVLKQRH